MFNADFKNKLYGYFTQRMGMEDYTRGWLKGDCPACGKTFKFGVQIARNKTNCFVCGYNDKPLEVIMEQEDLKDIHEVRKYLKTFEGATYLELPTELREELPEVNLPEGYQLVGISNNRTSQIITGYLKKRGFNIHKLMALGWGYTVVGSHKMRIIIPYYQAGKLIYYNARQFIDVGPKFLNPSEEQIGIGKSLILYNVDALALYNKVYLVESATNAATMGLNGVALGGKILSNYQLSTIINSPVEKIVVILDPDAKKEALKACLKLVNYKKVKVLIWDGEKDVNDLGRDWVKKLEKKTPWHTYQDIYRKYINAS